MNKRDSDGGESSGSRRPSDDGLVLSVVSAAESVEVMGGEETDLKALLAEENAQLADQAVAASLVSRQKEGSRKTALFYDYRFVGPAADRESEKRGK